MDNPDKPTSGQDRPRGRPTGRARPQSSAAPGGRQAEGDDQEAVKSRIRRYMVAVRPEGDVLTAGLGGPTLTPATLRRILDEDPRVTVVRSLRPIRPMSMVGGEAATSEIVVAEMDYEDARQLRAQYPQVRLERDRLLTYTRVIAPPEPETTTPLVQPLGLQVTFRFLIQGGDGKPLKDVPIVVIGSLGRSQAITGEDGRAEVTLFGEFPESIRAVLITPPQGHWSRYLDRPALSTDGDNVIRLRSLAESFSGFPDTQMFGWGQRAMNLDRLSPTLRAAGVKIAIIDSGAATSHRDLHDQVTKGIDLVDGQESGWTVDTVRHGSHCAGIVCGADNGSGVLGFAVEAEVHACKIFPGGRFSDLIEALDYCIDNRIDVVNLSLGSPAFSQFVAEKIDEARSMGVACVVAAGNDGGPVNFPGNLPTVLTVAAIGKSDAFPPDSAHAAEILEPQTPEGYFSARFTCHGPEVDVCAPGVAIVSSVPPNDYAAWDGTSMAAPHVTGLAALVLAHHGDFRGEFSARNARRVERLFQIIKSSCTPLNLGDPGRTGAGLPNALLALGPSMATVAPQPSVAMTLLDQLAAEMAQAGLALPPQSVASMPAATVPVIPMSNPAARHSIGARTMLNKLNEEMYAAGLPSGTPDPLA